MSATRTETDTFGPIEVAAEVARNYLELRGAQARLKVAQRNLETQRETLRLTKVRFDAGAGSPIDVASAQARLNATESAIPGLITAATRARPCGRTRRSAACSTWPVWSVRRPPTPEAPRLPGRAPCRAGSSLRSWRLHTRPAPCSLAPWS